MSHALPKRRKIEQIYQILRDYKDGLTQSELARKLDVYPSTIKKYLDQGDLPYVYEEPGDKRLRLHPDIHLFRLGFSFDEITILHIAARLLVRQTSQHNPHAASALRTLADVVEKADQNIGQHLAQAAAVTESNEQIHNKEYLATLRELTEARVKGRKVTLEYEVEENVWLPYTFSPYFIEPYAPGLTTHVIGFREPPGKIRTFKLERLRNVDVIQDDAVPAPADFDPEKLLEYAWGIWYTDAEPELVELHFTDQVRRRVLETQWHRKQQKPEVLADGSVIWRCLIAEPKEMEYWIRGWGANVQVLQPEWLRKRLKRQAQDLAQRYGIQGSPTAGPRFIAHTRNAEGERHDLIQHIRTVAQLAAQFAAPFGAADLARRLGLWHDVGKFNPEFQQYLLTAESEPKHKVRGPDHKAAGARLARELKLPILSLLIQGHHGGLQTKTLFEQWYEDKKGKTDEAIALAKNELPEIFDASPVAVPAFVQKDARAAEFFLRMLFSALVDADFLDTEQHFNPERAEIRRQETTIETLWQHFEQQQRQFLAQVADSPVNRLRGEIYAASLQAASQPPGLFRYTVPTGGGKTLSVLGFALSHARRHGLRRVIVAVPFITITEQTANVYRSRLDSELEGAPVVLEHHSGANPDLEQDAGSTAHDLWNRLAAENWDAPIIVTTTVQLFESLFANGTSPCRKLHRLAQSIIILDEAQALPVGLLNPILDALRELCTHYGSTVVLSTATQPAFEVIPAFQQLPTTEIIPDPARFFAQLSRVTYEWRLDPKPSWLEVAEWMRSEAQVLTIVNTKKDAMALLNALNDPAVLHLSTLLCGAHRRQVIKIITQRIKAGQPCQVVATQVVEAGVDIDFPLVMRAFGPLDSIIQAAGRANREGLLPGKGRVIVFDPAEGGLPLGNYRLAKETTRTLLQDGPPNMDDPAAVAGYFQLYYPLPNHDQPGIQDLRKALNYPEVAEKFRMIEDHTVSVVVPYAPHQPAIAELVARLRQNLGNRRHLLRQLQPYLVSIYQKPAKTYCQQGFISPILTTDEGDLLLGEWHGAYDPVRGLVVKDQSPDKLIL